MNIDWGIVGTILGALGLIAGFVYLLVEYRSGIFVKRKKLEYEILSRSQIIEKDQSSEYAKDLTIQWKGVVVDSLIVIPLVLECTGRKEIVPDDFHQPIKILGPGPYFLSASVTRTEPSNLINSVKLLPMLPVWEPSPSIDEPHSREANWEILQIEPLLLNHKNLIEITLLFSKFHSLELESHIAGVKIEERRSGFVMVHSEVFLGMAMVLAGISGMYLGVTFGELRASSILFGLLMIVFWGGTLISIVRRRLEKSRF